MSDSEFGLLKTLFYSTGGQFYEVIDKDGLRKPAITTVLSDVSGGSGTEETWIVTVNWRLLEKWMGILGGR